MYLICCGCFRTGSKLGISPLMLAAMNGHTAAVKLLLDMGSDINAQVSEFSQDGFSVLLCENEVRKINSYTKYSFISCVLQNAQFCAGCRYAQSAY